MEDNKYYIPSIEEFHIGFEYETSSLKKDQWIKKTCEADDIKEIEIAQIFDAGIVRVKYLDREDIESLEWDIITNYFPIYSLRNFRAYKTQGYGENHYCIQKFDDNQNVFDVFSGTIKNKSEFQRIIKMVGICNT